MWTFDSGSPPPRWRLHGGSALLSFSSRLGGVSEPPFDTLNLGRSAGDAPAAVAENRRRLLAALGFTPGDLVTAGQVHGAAVREAFAAGHLEACDVLVTRRLRLALAITTADCMPLLLVAPGAVAAAHAGWRGAAAGAPRAALDAVRRLAGASADVEVHLGPCIRSCCYRVGPEVAGRFPPAVVRRVGDALHLDLPGAARLQLLEAGLPERAWHDTGGCTACEPERYFSHRRDAGRTGRHWGVVAISE